MQNDLDRLETHIDRVLSPERAMRWMVRIVVLVIILGVCFVLGRVAWHMLGKVDKAVQAVEKQDFESTQAAEASKLDHNWFVLRKDAIDASSIEVSTYIDDLARHYEIVANRSMFSFKGKEDNREAVRLKQVIAAAQLRRLDLIRDYNAMAARVPIQIIGDLPDHIDVVEIVRQVPEVEAKSE